MEYDGALRGYIGDLSQVAGIQHIEYRSGRAKGVEGYEVRTGAGLRYTVLKDRCMDISAAEFRGVPLTHVTGVGVTSPQMVDDKGMGFLRGFNPGFLVTCGLTQAGSPCVDGGEELPLHGRIGGMPAEESGFNTEWAGAGRPEFRMWGKVSEATYFGAHAVLHRHIRSPFGRNVIRIRDEVVNEGYDDMPFMILYHLNYGYPLLQEGTLLRGGIRSATPRNARAAEGLADYGVIHAPVKGFVEQCYYLELDQDGDGHACIALLNYALGFGVYERYVKAPLPNLTMWKQLGEKYYTVGLEPANCRPDGRAEERAAGTLRTLAPGEREVMELEIGILDGEAEMRAFEDRYPRTPGLG
ncbi:MAG: aldose 1-epimerase family protein [Oscillospiraceae bacterium]|nr:aldose 1-epimerase family protein [Oscillospiraceae bacterium]